MRAFLAVLILSCCVSAQVMTGGVKLSGGVTFSGTQSLPMTGDNRYCTTSDTVTGLTDDTWGTVTAAKLAHCINTSVSHTPSNGTVRVINNVSDLNTAIAAMACGDVLSITAGVHISGSFILGQKNCDANHWITIESSGISDPRFPAEGTRTSPCWSGVQTIANRPVYDCSSAVELTARITVAVGASGGFQVKGDHYRFIGLEITRVSSPGIVFDLIDTPLTVATGVQHDIIVDRCWIHGVNADASFPYTSGGQSMEVQKGIFVGVSHNFGIIDNYISDIYCISSFGTCSDSQGIAGGISGTSQTQSGWGTIKIVNNYVESSTEGILSGGSSGPNLTPGGCTPLVNCNVDSPSDWEIRRNFFFKPAVWNGNTTVIVTSGWPVVKNGLELKNAVRVLLEGNVIRGTWNSAQPGFAFLLAPKNQPSGGVGSCLTCIVTDVAARFNYAYDIGEGPGLFTSQDNGCTNCASQGGYRIVIHDNLFDNINKGGISSNSVGDGHEFSANTGSPVNQIAFVHNTISKAIRSFAIWGAQTMGLMSNWYYENNIAPTGAFGLLHIDTGVGACDHAFFNNAKAILDACITTYSFQKNDIMDGAGANWPTDGSGANNFFHANSAIIFSNYNSGDSGFNPGNYLLQVSSPDHNAGTDGKDLGADINSMLTYISGVAPSVIEEDLMAWWLAPYAFRIANHTTGSSLYNAGWQDADRLKFWEQKNLAGHPWDVNLYGGTLCPFGICLWITENGDEGGFNNASGWKRFVTPPVISPRYFAPGSTVTFTTLGTNPIVRTLNCETDGEPQINIGDIQGVTTGPSTINYGGAIGSQTTIIVNYYYSGSGGVYQNRERFYLTKTFGWIQWDHAALITGVYVVDQTSVHNTLTAGAAPSPSWPCGTAFSWWVGGTPGAGGNGTIP